MQEGPVAGHVLAEDDCPHETVRQETHAECDGEADQLGTRL